MNYGMVLGAGLLAGATTCAVTQGGLLVGLITRQRKALQAHASAPRDRGKARSGHAQAAVTGTSSLSDDLAPVAGFLGGKFISHTFIGLLLGAIGGAVGFNPRVGAVAQWVAGLLMITLGLGSLNVPGFRALQFTPPASWLNVVRRSTRSQSTAAPFLLGLAVILVPCGVTISMEVLAASSGSPVTGALVMGLFVIGTAPMFTLYGFLSQRLRFNRAMSFALAVLVITFGLITVNAGLVASGSPFSVQALRGSLSGSATVDGNSLLAYRSTLPVGSKQGPLQTFTVDARSTGYVPNVIVARANAPIRLTFTSNNVWSCIRATVMPTLGKQVMLPQTGSGDIDLGPLAPGDYPISCSMGMYSATLHVTA